MKHLRPESSAFAAAFVLLLWASAASAQTYATGQFTVTITIQSTCTVDTSSSDIDFGSQGLLTTDLTDTSTIGVECTDGTDYTLGLDAGTGTGATVAARKMTGSGSNTVTYSLYQDSGYSTVWGDTSGNWQSGTGSGGTDTYTIYAKVPAQTTPAPDTYTDTITATVTY
jgi:spore coat protein U domain-containing protein, fimbrial subunit CupE1/2/3/6